MTGLAHHSVPSGPGDGAAPPPGHALEVSHLSVSFGPVEVIHDVSFSAAPGSVTAIIGPNGSGKTVLFRALIGAIRSSGAVRWAPGSRLGYVPQKLDIERNLPLAGIDLLRAKADVMRGSAGEVERVLRLVDLAASVAAQAIGTLSGGQFQRLLFAFALIGGPSVLLVDEPTAGVDQPGEEGIYALLRRLQVEERLTVLLISHDLSLVYAHSDFVLCLSRRRTWFGPPVEVLMPERLQELYGAPMRFHVHDVPSAH